jgi:Terminase large subunit, T4likevirus-type, N-terminal
MTPRRPKARSRALSAGGTPSLLRAAKLFGVEPYPRQAQILEQIDSGTYREVVLALGRRSGKNLLGAIVALHDALFRDLRRYLRTNEKRYIVAVAANREQAGLTLDYVRQLLEGSPLREALLEETADELTLRQPGTGALVGIKTMPCSARAGRGLAISTLLLDECAHWISDSDGFQTAERVHAALAPSTAQFGPDGRLLYLSTPWGRAGLFYTLFERAGSGAHADMLAITAPSWEMNPKLGEDFFERERAKDPELFRGEYGAEFLASGAQFLPHERIEAAIDDERFELPATELRGAVAGIDAAWASDPFALAIVGREETDPRMLRVAAVRSWRPPKGDELSIGVLDEIAALCRSYNVGQVVCDQYCSAPVRQLLGQRGISAREHTMTAPSKTGIFSTLKAKLLAGELELYREKQLLEELARVEAVYGGGSASIRLPRVAGSHCDMAQALAQAVHALAGGRSAPMSPEYAAHLDELLASRGPASRALSGGISKTVF